MLVNYIKDLLCRYDCVIIPDFGSMMTQTNSAKIDEQTQTFSPPTKHLVFDPNLTESDDLLINYIADKDQISLESAENFINFQVDEWKEKLKTQELILDGFGSFSADEMGNISFEQSSHADFLSCSFGLADVQTADTSLGPEENDLDNDAQFVAPVQKRKRKKKSGSRMGNILMYAATFAILFVIGWFMMKQIIQNNAYEKEVTAHKESQDLLINKYLKEATFEIKTPLAPVILKLDNQILKDTLEIPANEIEAIPTDFQAKILPDATKLNTENKTETVKEQTKKPTETTASKTFVSKNSTTYFYIIAGAFSDPVNAEKKVSQLKNEGYQATVVPVGKSKLFQVAFAKYNSKTEAEQALAQIKTKAPEAWILKR